MGLAHQSSTTRRTWRTNRAWRNSVGKCKQAKLCIYSMNLTPEKPENEEEVERAGDGVVREDSST